MGGEVKLLWVQADSCVASLTPLRGCAPVTPRVTFDRSIIGLVTWATLALCVLAVTFSQWTRGLMK